VSLDEENISAQGQEAGENSRFLTQDEHTRRPGSPEESASQRKKEVERIGPATGPLDFCMDKALRLRKNSEFKMVYRLGRSFANSLIVMYVRPTPGARTRAGFVARRTIGRAYVRNRMRRLLRESYRLNRPKILLGFDLVFVARKGAKSMRLREVHAALVDLLTRGGVFR
jgi:ribonuclease P protein component